MRIRLSSSSTATKTGWTRITDGCVRIETLDPQAAIELLLALSGQQDAHAAAELAEELDYLPLALHQAGAYLHQSRMDIATYLDNLRRDPAGTLQRVAAGDPSEHTVARVWSVTLARIVEEDRVAVKVLNVLSWLAPDDLPRDVLHHLSDGQAAVDHALGVLASYNMIDLTAETVTVHRLVQAVIRAAAIADGSATATQQEAINLLSAAAPDNPIDPIDHEGWPRWAALLPHIHALGSHLPADHQSAAMLDIQDNAATYQLSQGRAATAIAGYQRVLTNRQRVQGKDHPATLATRHYLALAHLKAGHIADAITQLDQLLTDQRRIHGDNHPDTLLARHVLADAHRVARQQRRRRRIARHRR